MDFYIKLINIHLKLLVFYFVKKILKKRIETTKIRGIFSVRLYYHHKKVSEKIR